jgi:hypothetical protein
LIIILLTAICLIKIQSTINKGRLRFSEAQQNNQLNLVGLDGK